MRVFVTRCIRITVRVGRQFRLCNVHCRESGNSMAKISRPLSQVALTTETDGFRIHGSEER
jgi:hypothetical protein